MGTSPYLAGHLKRIAEEEARTQERLRVAQAKAEQIAMALRKEFPGVEVVLFGSLATGQFELDSDIDLAVKGLPEEHYLKAYGIAESIADPIKVDIVQLEFPRESLRSNIERDGVIL